MSSLAKFVIENDVKADNKEPENSDLEEFVQDIFSGDLTIDSKQDAKEDLRSLIFSEDEVQYYDGVQDSNVLCSEKSETKKIESNQGPKYRNFYLKRKERIFRFRIEDCKMSNERRKLLKQSLINVGIRNKEKMQEGLLFQSLKLNIDQTIALCQTCNTNYGEFSFYLCKFFLLEKMIESNSTFTLDKWKTYSATIKLPEAKIEANSLDWEERKHNYYSLFGTKFTYLNLVDDKEMIKNTLKKIEGKDYKDPVLSNFPFLNKRYDNARCVIAKKLAELGKEKEMKAFLIEQLDQFVSKKRLRTDEEEEKYTVLSSHKKIKIEAAVQKSEYKEENELPAKKAPEESKKEDLAADWELPDLPPEPLAEEDLPDLPPEPTLEPESEEPYWIIEPVTNEGGTQTNQTRRRQRRYEDKRKRQKLIADYKRTVQERNKELKVKKLSWVEILFWSVAIYAMDLYLPYRAESGLQVTIGVIIGIILFIRILHHSANYVWTILTVVFVRWFDTSRFSFVPGEVYAVIALQMLLVEKRYAMIIPLVGFVIYTIVYDRHWIIYLHYTVTAITSLKEARVEHDAASIILAPYSDILVGLMAIGVTIGQFFGLISQ